MDTQRQISIEFFTHHSHFSSHPVDILTKIVFWGDSHIPYRSNRLPKRFIEFLIQERPDIMVVTGDLVIYSVLDSVRHLAKNVYAVRGNMDEGDAMKLPLVADFTIGDIKFSVFHGHGIYPRGDPEQLLSIARKRSARVIITGHTHSPAILAYHDAIILNPGSVCGVWGGAGGYEIPTWGKITIEDRCLQIVIYELTEDQVITREQRIIQL